MNTTPERVGFYCWAGPGTVRMINLKFFEPHMDLMSLMGSYEYDYLAKIQEVFGVTDFWATYSWGFAPAVEEEDHTFLLSKVENFKKLGIRLHAYVQGPNVVYRDFADKDWFCKDEKGRTVAYHRGRRVTCVNNPEFREYQREKILAMYDKGFDGVYMDNIQMGQLGIAPKKHPILFAGCACEYCKAKFHERTGESIPVDYRNAPLFAHYMQHRADSVTDFVREMAAAVHDGAMEFGTNSFDPQHDTKTIFGTDLDEIAKLQDYLLFENHAAPRKSASHGNEHAKPWTHQKPVFVVSYKKGIGKEQEFSQTDFDHMYSEAVSHGFYPCIKGSEYSTKGIWHNMNPALYQKPRTDMPLQESKVRAKSRVHSISGTIPTRLLLRRYYNPLFRLYMESRVARKLLNPLYYRAIR